MTATQDYFHEVGFYGSDQDFADLIVPFANEGLTNDEPVVFAYDEHKTSVLRDLLPADPAITYITDNAAYASPAKALSEWRALVERRVAAGASRVRVAGDVPHPGYGTSYAGWDRYEAALDRVMCDLPVWAPCLYDTRITPADVLARARSLHQHVREPDGSRRANDDYRSPSGLGDFLPPEPDPLELLTPTFEVWDPSPRGARDVVRFLVANKISAEREEDLVLAVSEAVTNGRLHGQAPVVMRCWSADGRVVINVVDRGTGPKDPLVGLLPQSDHTAMSGRGLNIVHKLDLDVSLSVTDDGFKVRLREELD